MNIWSDSHWSELNKQFNKSVEFPLPGQVGVAWQSSQQPQSQDLKEKKQPVRNGLQEENIEYLIQRPLSQEFQALKLKEAAGGLYYKSKIDSCLFNLANKGNMFELNFVKCPASLIKGRYLNLKYITLRLD